MQCCRKVSVWLDSVFVGRVWIGISRIRKQIRASSAYKLTFSFIRVGISQMYSLKKRGNCGVSLFLWVQLRRRDVNHFSLCFMSCLFLVSCLYFYFPSLCINYMYSEFHIKTIAFFSLYKTSLWKFIKLCIRSLCRWHNDLLFRYFSNTNSSCIWWCSCP